MPKVEEMRNLEAKSRAKMLSWSNSFLLDAKVKELEKSERPACVMLESDEEIEALPAWTTYCVACFDANVPDEIKLAEAQLEIDLQRLALRACCVCKKLCGLNSFCHKHDPAYEAAHRSVECLKETVGL